MKNNYLFYVVAFLIFLTLSLFFVNKYYFEISKSFIWAIVTVMMLISGMYFSFKYKFKQLKIIKTLKSLFKKNSNDISNFEALSISLGARIGVGSLSGVALSIYVGGPGTIFWIWVISIIISINTYVESYLGVIYQEKDKSIGGPSCYIDKGLHNKKLAILYSVLILIAYILCFIPIQANTIVKSISFSLNIDTIFIIFILGIFSIFIIFGNLKKLAVFSSKIVPFMLFFYFFIGLLIIINNINLIPNILVLIVKSAFSFKSSIMGFIATFIIGIQRGVFASEAGIGTSAIASSITDEKPESQALCQAFGVNFTTLIVCTITALIILTSNYQNIVFNNLNGIELTLFALKDNFGIFGEYSLLIITILFAFSTIISGYYYGEMSLKYIFLKISDKNIFIFKIIVIIIIIFATVINSTIIWNFTDILVAFLAIINIYSIAKIESKIDIN